MNISGHVDNQRAQLAQQIDDLMGQKQYQLALPLAIDLVERALTECGEGSTEYSQDLTRLADVYRALGKFAEAKPIYRKIVDVFTMAENDAKLSASLNDLAVTLIEMHDYEAAEPLLRRALAIDLKTGGDDCKNSDDYLGTLSNLGMLKFYEGKYSEAEPLLRQTLEARRLRGKNDLNLALSLNNLAALYQAINEMTTAEKLFKQGLQIRRDHADHLGVAESLNNLALLYRETGRYPESEPLYQEGLEIYRSQLGESHPKFIRLLSNLASVYFCLSDFEHAKPLVQQALATQRKLGHQMWALSITLNNLASLYYAAGQYDSAEPLYQESIALGQQCVGERHPRLRTRISNLAGMYVAMRREPEALALMREVMAIDDRLIANVFPIASERQRITYLTAIQQDLDDILSLISNHFTDSSSIVSEGLDIVLRRKGLVAESLAARRDELLTGRYPTLEPKLRELHRLRSKLAEATLVGRPGPDTVQMHKDRLAQLEQEAERIEVELARDLPELSLQQRLISAERRALARALPEGAVLVEFVRFSARDFGAAPRVQSSTRYAAFVMMAGDPDKVRLVDLGEAESTDRLVSEFRKSISSAPTWLTRLIGHFRRAFNRDVGEILRSRIFDPLGLSPGDQQHLFLATEGALAWIPFEALPLANGDYLIDQYYISYLSVGRDLLRLQSIPALISTDAVVVADPNFDLSNNVAREPATTDTTQEPQSRDIRSEDLYFPRLQGSRTEGEKVSQMLGVRPWLWDSAVEGRLKKLRSPRILHLATHGFFLSNQTRIAVEPQSPADAAEWDVASDTRLTGPGMENPLLRSGLAFSGANTWLAGGSTPAAAEDGILNAVDVSSLNLVGTELAVLSACETGLGTVHVWEGVFGLRRAFALAGVRTLVMTLWKVADQQTTDLMEDFYQQLLAGKPRGEALREAQLTLKKRYPSPFYWGAFICQGDTRPLAY